MKKSLFFLAAALLGIFMTACGPDPVDTVEAKIKTISIKNTTYNGVVDNTTFTVTFNDVAAETNIEAIQFVAQLSLGAHLDKETYDFTVGASADGKELTQTINVINGEVAQAYTVIINLTDPTSDPILDKLVMKKGSDGTEVTAQIIDGVLALGMPEETEATFVSISIIPARATYKFTAMQNDKLTADNPGQFEMDFMGRKTVMDITFKAAPTPGVDIAAAVVHDFSVATENAPAAFAAENTRGTDFDGEHVLVVARSADGAAAEPHLYKVTDLLADTASNRINLNVDGINGGTHIVSSGSLNHGHIYLCNLTTTLSKAAPLKVYHYADANATPDVWSWDGNLGIDEFGDTIKAVVRLGDNISVNLDESGNGYAFFCGQESSAERIYRVEVANFNEFSNPTEITLEATFAYYGRVNQVDNDRYFFSNLNKFDEAMVHLLKDNLAPVKDKCGVHLPWVEKLCDNEGDQVVAYQRGKLVFVFNWNGVKSFDGYGIPVAEGKYKVVLNTDAEKFAGFGLSDDSVEHFTSPDEGYLGKGKGWLQLYLPARSAVVLQKVD